MNDKKKARPASGTAGAGQGENAACGGAAFSNIDSTTPPARRQVVAEWLEHGAQNGKPMRRLKGFLNGSSREIRLAIQRERLNGTPILSGQSGYHLPGNDDEVRHFCRSMRHRAREIWQTAANVERAAGLTQSDHQIDGQIYIWGEGDA